MKTFNDWYTKINEELAEPVATVTSDSATADVDVKADRDAMISDVDAIMTSLETLAGELKEELEVSEEVNEADSELGAISDIATKAAIGAAAAGGATALAAKWVMNKIKAKKATKAQQGINSMLMKVELAKLKAKEAEDANAKEAMNAKIEDMKSKAEELQTAYVEKFKDNNLAAKALESERLKGSIARMEFLAKETGSESYKKEMLKLQDSYKDTLADLDKIKKEGEEATKKAKEAEAESPEKSDQTESPESTDTEQTSEEPTDSEETTNDSEEEVPSTTVSSDDKEEKSEEPAKNSKEGKLSRLDALLKKAEEIGADEKIKKIKDLIDRVSAKESWQLDNTVLGQLLESEIKKLESEQVLFESNALSIKDRFSKLI